MKKRYILSNKYRGISRKGGYRMLAIQEKSLYDIKEKMILLKERAKQRKIDSSLRHTPNIHDINIANKNAIDMNVEQFKTIK